VDPQLRAALRELNRRFYADHAAAFDRTRAAPWPGFSRVAACLFARARASRSVAVLDVGCGNARLAGFFAAAYPERAAAIDYLGLDASAALLERARARAAGLPRAELRACDVLAEGALEALAPRRFDLVTALGLLHHVPGEAARRALLVSLCDRVADGGLLAVSLWRFGAFERFRARARPWDELAAHHPDLALDPAGLEPGDFLLGFGAAPGPLRFCHWIDDAETDRLACGLPLPCALRSDDDGGLNRYLLFARGAAPSAAAL
jgi:SAM-dependent methyltransferase